MKILAVDLGKVRTGIAISDINEFLASPLCVIKEKDFEQLVCKVAMISKENHAEKIIVGLPKNMDGTEGGSAKNARLFAEELQKVSGICVEMLDERGTTITAQNYLNFTDTKGKKRKNVIDAVAATIILQNYLDAK